jgi:FkbH-like protein
VPPPLKTTEYLREARRIEATFTPATPTLALLATFTADLLKPYLLVESERRGLPLRPWFGPFQQLEQMVLDDASPLWQQRPAVLAICLRLEDVDRYLPDEAAELGPTAVEARLRVVRERLVALAQAARKRTTAPLLIANLAVPHQYLSHTFDAGDPDGFTHQLASCNRELARELQSVSDAHVLDAAGLVARRGGETWVEPKLWYMARAAVGAANQPELAATIVRTAVAALRVPAKCIVVDLDNTLWGGVLGDDGPAGVKLGDEYPGNVFKDFQALLLGYRRRGFLLAIASKNNEDAVLEMLANHSDMLLRREHFAAIAADWNPKADQLRRIAQTLNIGLDALVFVDDNPVERAHIRAELPMVHVVEMPESPLGYAAALRDVALLDRLRTSSEDRARAEMVRSDADRRSAEVTAGSIDDFLRGLQMTVEVGQADATTLDRVHQLINKTNQFNLTTTRYSLDEVRRLAESAEARVAWLRLADRYGDLGLVCVGIVRRTDERAWEIDTLLMSCRVMGRQVETAFLAYLGELVREAGGNLLRGAFLPTAKNQSVATFYPAQGFTDVTGETSSTTRRYELALSADALRWPDLIQRTKQPSEPRP